jgi:hypothetical protein
VRAARGGERPRTSIRGYRRQRAVGAGQAPRGGSGRAVRWGPREATPVGLMAGRRQPDRAAWDRAAQLGVVPAGASVRGGPGWVRGAMRRGDAWLRAARDRGGCREDTGVWGLRRARGPGRSQGESRRLNRSVLGDRVHGPRADDAATDERDPPPWARGGRAAGGEGSDVRRGRWSWRTACLGRRGASARRPPPTRAAGRELPRGAGRRVVVLRQLGCRAGTSEPADAGCPACAWGGRRDGCTGEFGQHVGYA